jgi:hypothetical protein
VAGLTRFLADVEGRVRRTFIGGSLIAFLRALSGLRSCGGLRILAGLA